VALRELLDSLDAVIFQADDSLGWTYQFWQAQRKEDVNDSGTKIGADELPAVTQLFTEDYMVEFLLHNTLGAWWAGKRGPITALIEAEARGQVALPAKDGVPALAWPYLRFVQDETAKTWLPAAGTFEGWPKTLREVTVLDPCMGSGHFLAFVLPIIVRLRMEEEGLSVAEAVAATIRDNVHGLELDPRCTQIGAFNVALTAWKLGGFQALPPLHIACSGLAPNIPEADWIALAGSNEKLRNGMQRLYSLFENAPVLGSLINPRAEKGGLLAAGYQELQPLLEKAVAKEAKDDTAHETAVTASGIAKAAELLAERFTLVITNVPYLGRGKQDGLLQEHCEHFYPDAKADLATCFVERCLHFTSDSGTAALVTPLNWLFLSRYKGLRKKLLARADWRIVARLGPRAFETIGGEVVSVALLGLTRSHAATTRVISGLDVEALPSPEDKSRGICAQAMLTRKIVDVLADPDSIITFSGHRAGSLLADYADTWQGLVTCDDNKFVLRFWEVVASADAWRPLQLPAQSTTTFTGKSVLIRWERGAGSLHHDSTAHNFPPPEALDRPAVAMQRTSDLNATLMHGEVFGDAVAPIFPKDREHLAAIWAFAESGELGRLVRQIDKQIKTAVGSFLKVPFDLTHWQEVASTTFPKGLPRPGSSDPTQRIFSGHPKDSDNPLHVAVARVGGYQWPRQIGAEFCDCPSLGPDGLEKFADEDGIVCLPALNKEQPAASRLRNTLAAALGSYSEASLLAETDAKSKTLEDWLRDEFFEQHCKLFHNRPIIWHVWDGRKDGFAALVNCHRLDHNTLKKLTYSYLGDWIRQQQDDVRDDKAGAAERLGAAQELQAELAAILEGETPYDIFVRWKPLSQQAIGWHPDLNDGVRLNIRPFLMAQDVDRKGAGILRWKPNIKWDKDRGKEPKRDKADFPWFWCEAEPEQDPAGEREFAGHRWNDVHLTLARKRASRK
jgi:hypothetical protein